MIDFTSMTDEEREQLFEKMLANGEINQYFYDQLSNNIRFSVLSNNLKNVYLEEAKLMTRMGIESNDDQRDFFYIQLNVPDILNDILGRQASQEERSAVIDMVFANREHLTNNMLDLMNETARVAKQLSLIRREAGVKLGYPHSNFSAELLPSYNLERWMSASRSIYDKMRQGYSRSAAEKMVTGDWNPMEQIDYKHWLRFFEEKVPEKYPKLAQMRYYEPPNQNGVYIPVGRLKADLPQPIHDDKPKEEKHDVNDVRQRIESQRYKIISRLNAAERLLYSMDGQEFAGDDQEIMLKMLQDLKRKVQTSNKFTVRSSLFEDFIYKAGNQLRHQGKDNAAGFFYKIAQSLDELSDPLGGAPSGVNFENDTGLQPDPTAPADGNETAIALKEFMEHLNTGVAGDDSDTRSEREAKKKPSAIHPLHQTNQPQPQGTAGGAAQTPPSMSGPGMPPAGASKEDADIVVYAQQVDPVHRPPGQRLPTKNTIDIQEKKQEFGMDETDDVIEAALKNITINDAIRRLEMLVGIYKKREIARQVAILDIMLDRLGLASFFPPIGESLQKSLEATQYISTRLEDVLNKLKGSIEMSHADSIVEEREDNPPQTKGIRDALKQQNDIENERRKARKEREIERINEKSQEAPASPPPPPADLGGPVNIERPAPPIQV